MLDGQSDNKGRAFGQFADSTDGPSVPVGDSAADGQSDSGAFELAASMETLKNSKDFLGVFFLESNSVVLDGQFAEFIDRVGFAAAAKIPLENLGVDFDNGLGVGRLELQSVPNEILQKLTHLERVCLDGGEGAAFDFGFGHQGSSDCPGSPD